MGEPKYRKWLLDKKKEFVTYLEAFSTLAKPPKMVTIEVHENIIVNNNIDMFTSITAFGIFE